MTVRMFLVSLFQTDLRKVLDSHKKIQSNISSREAKLVPTAHAPLIPPSLLLPSFHRPSLLPSLILPHLPPLSLPPSLPFPLFMSHYIRLEQIQKSSFDLKAEEERCERAVDRVGRFVKCFCKCVQLEH